MAALLAKALAIATIIYSPCPGDRDALACTLAPNVVYIASGSSAVGVLNHELGHVIDFNFLTDVDRGRFQAYARKPHAYLWRGLAYPTVWWGEPNPFGEEFAEAVRMCARSTRFPDSSSVYNWTPTTTTHRRVCRWLAYLGATK